MFQRRTCTAFVLMSGLAAMPALAQQQNPGPHHPPGMGPAAQGSPGDMSGGAMPGMGMMRMMGQDGIGGMPMMAAMTGHVEGQLAFLKTELKITDAQLPLWNKVADAIRANANPPSQTNSDDALW